MSKRRGKLNTSGETHRRRPIFIRLAAGASQPFVSRAGPRRESQAPTREKFSSHLWRKTKSKHRGNPIFLIGPTNRPNPEKIRKSNQKSRERSRAKTCLTRPGADWARRTLVDSWCRNPARRPGPCSQCTAANFGAIYDLQTPKRYSQLRQNAPAEATR